MTLIDTHAHLYWDSYKADFNEVIQRALDAGVSAIINVGVDVEKSKKAVQVSKKLALSEPVVSGIEPVEGYSTIGIHPHEAVKYTHLGQKYSDRNKFVHEDMTKLEEIYKSNPEKVVAVGECGLDYFFDPSFAEASEGKSLSISQIKILQRKLFQAQIDLAKKLNLPAVVHCRDDRSQNPTNSQCWDEVIEITKDHFGIYHCYSGLEQTTKRVLEETKFLISFAANITYPKNEYLREAAKLLPLNKILLETDSPFLSPQSKRGQRNEPASVKEIAELIADLKGVSFAEVAQQTTTNVKKIFNIDPSTRLRP